MWLDMPLEVDSESSGASQSMIEEKGEAPQAGEGRGVLQGAQVQLGTAGPLAGAQSSCLKGLHGQDTLHIVGAQ